MPTKVLAIDLIVALPSVQPRKELNKDALARYEESYKAEGKPVLPALRVFYDGETYLLSRGFHRLKAAIGAKRASLECEIMEGVEFDAILDAMADLDNLECGVPFTNEDKRKSVIGLLDHPNCKGWSQLQISESAHCSKSLVRDVVAERKEKTPPKDNKLPGACGPTEGEKVDCKDGKQRPKTKRGVKGGIKSVEKDPAWDNIALGLAERLEEINPKKGELKKLSEKNMDQQREIVKLVDGESIKTIKEAISEYEGETVVPKDANKVLIPEHLIEVMTDNWFAETGKALKKISEQVVYRAQKNPYWKANLSEVFDNLKDYARWFSDCQPAVVCPSCKGTGKRSDGKPCGWCVNDVGWMPAWTYNDWKAKSKVK
jgi:hypothetical protein